MHRLQPPRWSSRSACGRPVHSIDCPGRLAVRRLAQPALKHRTVARHTHSQRRSRTAGSAAATRSNPAAGGGFSALAPLHGIIPRRPSQRSHASRNCVAQLSLGSRWRQGHLSTTRMNQSATLSTCMPSSLAWAAEVPHLLGDEITCSHPCSDDIGCAAPCARSASKANSTRWLDHQEGVVAMASAACHTFQAIQ